MRKITNFCIKHSLLCIIFFSIITLFFGWKATSVKIDSDLVNVLPKADKNNFESSDSYIFLGFRAKEGEELLSIEGLNSLYKVISELETLPEVKQSLSIFNTETLLIGNNNRLYRGTTLPGGTPPKNLEELEIFKTSVLNDPFFENLLVSDDSSYIITAFLTEKSSDNNVLFNNELNRIVEPLRLYVDVSLAGDFILMNRAEYYLGKDFSTLLVAALLVMLVILFISFRARRALLLPVLVVIIGVIWTVGFISLVGFKLSVVTCVVPALVLTIGSSYTIHVLNEFFRNAPKENSNNKKWITEAVNHVNKTILMASLTTIIGFLSLLTGSQNVIKQFALSVSFGVAATAILSLFLLPSIFSMLKDPTQLHARAVHGGFISKILGKLGPIIIKTRFLLILLGLVLGFSLYYVVPKLTVGSNYYNYFPEDDEVINEILYVTKMSGGSTWINLTLEAPTGSKRYFATNEGLDLQSRIEAELRSNDYVYDVVSMVSYLKKINKLRFGNYELPKNKGLTEFLLRSFSNLFNTDEGLFKEVQLVEEEYNKVTFLIRIFDKEKGYPVAENDFPAFLNSISNVIATPEEGGIKTTVWGEDYVANTISSILLKDQVLTLIVSFFLVFLVTCFYFKSIYYGFVAIIPLITAVCSNYIFMVVLKIPLDVTTIMVSSVAIGVGVDDAIHFLIQFKYQIKNNPKNIKAVLQDTLTITGRPIVLTTISIVAGMLVLVLASFLPIGYFGILVTISLIGALIGTLIFLPAVLVVTYNLKNLRVFSFRSKN